MTSVLVLLLITAALADASSFQITMRKMYVITAQTQQDVAVADQIYASFAQSVASSKRYHLIPVDSIQTHFNAVLLSDFAVKYDAVELLDYSLMSGLDVALFFYLEKTRDAQNMYVKAVEFPSDIFISDLYIPLSLKNMDVAAAVQTLESFVNMIWLNRHDVGYGFHNSEKGILFVADDLNSPDLRSVLKGVAQAQSRLYENDHRDLKVKVIELLPTMRPMTSERADSLMRRLNSQALLLFSLQNEQQIYFPTRMGRASVLDNALPLWPPQRGFRLFSAKIDSAYGHDLGQSLLPQAGVISELVSKWPGPGDGARSLLLKNIQTLQADAGHGDENARALTLLYDALAHCFSPNDAEFGWIKLNQASLLKEKGDLVASLDASRAAFAGFQSTFNSFGQLFSLLQSGDTLEKLNRSAEALTDYQDALNYSREIDDVHASALIYFRLGSIKFDEDELIEAWDHFGNSADSYLRVGDTLKVVQLSTKLGILMRQSNFLKKSAEYLEYALALAMILHDDRESADAGYQLAITLKDLGEKQKALDHFQTVGDLMEMLADTIGLANTEEHIGDILFEDEQWKSAQQSFEYSARFYKYIPDIEGIIRSVTKAGDTAAARKRWLRAQNNYDEALQFANVYEKTDWVSIIIYKKGLAHVRAGDYAVGQEELELARQGDVSPEAINLFMKSFIRDLEQELEKSRP
ncbi:hypothetical protein JXA02_11735 [candidate division KSB1 bacterium]|nr:hypothetical protein [candidate division KSB1 bacterium]RQW02166.1 MAG: hypothetical protein EH222_14015 [candidate division KSB1 bacterium]